ncbi:hypothetical protein NPIL_643991 [Nephila pilipes]|uniref:Uncharacterized protein n=1 Tax=Nephila pilipes TaxID=299642 RepID=A0A8X6QYL6_NEPPI|nr:hypothetical protein NPIL_643991 [Nephila pilipes]
MRFCRLALYAFVKSGAEAAGLFYLQQLNIVKAMKVASAASIVKYVPVICYKGESAVWQQCRNSSRFCVSRQPATMYATDLYRGCSSGFKKRASVFAFLAVLLANAATACQRTATGYRGKAYRWQCGGSGRQGLPMRVPSNGLAATAHRWMIEKAILDEETSGQFLTF